MQLTLFIVIVTFAHLSCEVQSESIPNIVGEMSKLPEDCKANLIKQMRDECSGNHFHTQLVEVSECQYKCEEEHNNGKIMGTFSQSFPRKDGTPCGHSKVCIKGKCVQTCNLDFMKTDA
uniref:Putative ixostatin n=1 Tax=Ixodes ricinus TaxID=34613 RepID=A0A0K8RBQ0_IXORI